MSFDYTEIAGIAQELVAEFGRAVTLRQVATTGPDPAQPWRGPVDPRSAPVATLAVTACMVEPSSARELGLNVQVTDWLKRAQQIAIVASADDLSEYSELVDSDTSVWRVVGVSTLQPGATRILHYVGVAR